MRLILKMILVNLVLALTFGSKCAAENNEPFFTFTGKENMTNETHRNRSEVDTEGKYTTELNWEALREKLHASLNYVTRCSRRFSPGICTEPVASVWTFSFTYQNCTERLGCRIAVLSNRFKTYEMCMYSCKPLVDVYTHILDYQERTKGSDEQDSDNSVEFYESDELEDDAVMSKAKNARRRGMKTLENLITSVKEDYENIEEPSIGFPEVHDGEPPEDLQRYLPADLDHGQYESMDVNYDFNTGQARNHRRRGFH